MMTERLTQEIYLVHYLPVVTTILSAVFCVVLLRRYRSKGSGHHLLWWAGGVAAYGLGTALEGSITLWSNSIFLTKAWYIAGALFGGYPLAQGTVYLLLRRKTANTLTLLSLPVICILAILVAVSPVNAEALQPHRPSGDVLIWTWLRLCTPFVNLYAALFLIGGAVLSAYRFAGKRATRHRARGNALIAAGALLPGIGGGMAKAGMVEGLYVGEIVGILLIWAGYQMCVRTPVSSTSAHKALVNNRQSELSMEPSG